MADDLESNTSSELLELALDTSTHEWRENLKEVFNHPTDKVPVSIWDYVMKRRRTRAGLQMGSQEVHYVKVTSEESILQHLASQFHPGVFETQQASISSVSMSTFFPRRYQMDINIVDREEQSRLQLIFNGLNSSDIQQSLEFMWDGNIFADVLVGFPYSGDVEDGKKGSVAIFSCHQFVLRSRSTYFRDILDRAVVDNLVLPKVVTTTETTLLVTMPSSKLKPLIWEVIFRFLYTGKFQFKYSPQNFSNDLLIAFDIYKASIMVRLSSLKAIAYHAIIEMLHGLFHAPMSPDHYDQLIRGIWSNTQFGGCKCQRCAHHVPVVLRLSLDKEFKDPILERGARRALVGLFGPGWCTDEFSALPTSTHISILNELRTMITPRNVFAMIFAVENAFLVLGSTLKGREDVIQLLCLALVYLEGVLINNILACFNCAEWEKINKKSAGDVKTRADSERKVRWIVKSVLRAIHNINITPLQQTIESFSPATQEFSFENLELVVIWAEQITLLKDYFLVSMGRHLNPQTATRKHSGVPHIPNRNPWGKSDDDGEGTTESMAFTSTRFTDLSSSVSLASYVTALESQVVYSGDYHISVQTIESLTSSFSNASSRTASTDYGTFYRRMCLSEDFTEDLEHQS